MKSSEETVSVELTIKQVAAIKSLFGEMIPSVSSSGIYSKTCEILPITPYIKGSIEFSPGMTRTSLFARKVAKTLESNGYADPNSAKHKEVI